MADFFFFFFQMKKTPQKTPKGFTVKNKFDSVRELTKVVSQKSST